MPRRLTGFVVASVLELCAAAWLNAGHAQNAQKPTVPVPDFSGGWNSTIKWKFEAPAAGPGPVMDDPENVHHGHVVSPDGKDQAANAWVGDITNPILKPWAAEVIKRRNEEGLAGGEQRTAEAMCWPGGVPNILTRAEPVFFLQTPKQITMVYQRDQQVRRIYLNQDHSKDPGKSWYGESVGHYEGDTLVVDTVGMNDKSIVDYFGTPHTDSIHVVERYRMVDGGKTLEVAFSVDDPKTFTTPWTAMAHYRRSPQPVATESVCAEVSMDMFTKQTLPIPVANKSDF